MEENENVLGNGTPTYIIVTRTTWHSLNTPILFSINSEFIDDFDNHISKTYDLLDIEEISSLNRVPLI